MLKHRILLVIVILVIFGCYKNEDFLSLTRAELNGKKYTQFEGVYLNKVYSAGSIRFYSSIEFLSNYQYVATLRDGYPGNYTYSNCISNYKLDEMSARIRFPQVDTVEMGNPPEPTPVYLADWILEIKTDSMLVFRRQYADTTRIGYYETSEHVALKLQ
jgi:hypothetical protein